MTSILTIRCDGCGASLDRDEARMTMDVSHIPSLEEMTKAGVNAVTTQRFDFHSMSCALRYLSGAGA